MPFDKEKVFNDFMNQCEINAKIPKRNIAEIMKSHLELMKYFQIAYDAGVADGIEESENINRQIREN